MTKSRQQILITGARGMLGKYIKESFSDPDISISSLGISQENNFSCDLSSSVPSFGTKRFDTVVHCAGTASEKDALAVNHQGTLNLLKALDAAPPKHFVFISSFEVYSHDAGELVDEDRQLWATSKTGQSKALAEKALTEWCAAHDVVLTILRPARMFGTGIKGEMLTLFNDAVDGHYIHIRDNDARLSVVTALDVARFTGIIYEKGGTYNLSDGINPRLIDLVEAMTENHGARKRPSALPIKWARLIWNVGKIIPIINRQLSPEVIKKRSTTLTLDNSRALAAADGFSFHNTLDVIARRDPSYPYESK